MRLYNVIAMSQSCDLAQHKLNLVLVCPYWGLTELEAMDARFKSSKMKEEVRRGNVPAYHMLAACDLEGLEHEIQIVDFRTVFSVPFDFLTKLEEIAPAAALSGASLSSLRSLIYDFFAC